MADEKEMAELPTIADKKPKKMTPQMRLFCEAYMGRANWNASKAARLAEYADRGAGYDLLKRDDVQAYISQRIAAEAVTANEVLHRLGEHSRVTQDDFWEESEEGERYINLNSENAREKFHLIKKLKMKKRTFKERDPDDPETLRPIIETEIELETYDAQAALAHLGRHLKLFTDKVEHSGQIDTGVVMVPAKAQTDEWNELASEAKK